MARPLKRLAYSPELQMHIAAMGGLKAARRMIDNTPTAAERERMGREFELKMATEGVRKLQRKVSKQRIKIADAVKPKALPPLISHLEELQVELIMAERRLARARKTNNPT